MACLWDINWIIVYTRKYVTRRPRSKHVTRAASPAARLRPHIRPRDETLELILSGIEAVHPRLLEPQTFLVTEKIS